MTDLTRILTHTCPSNFHWSIEIEGSVGTYVVTYDRGAWSCTCPGFTHHKRCKHVGDPSIHAKRCGWAADAFANTTYHEEVCPECGEPTEAFYYGA